MDEKNIEVARTVWPWKQAENNAGRGREIPLKRVVVKFSIMFFIASALLFVFHHVVLSVIVYCLSFLVLVGGLFLPAIFRFFDRLGKFLAASIGRLLTYLLLVPFYYFCFLSSRIVLLMFRKDPMKRRFDHNTKTYWLKRQQSEDIEHYKVQYK